MEKLALNDNQTPREKLAIFGNIISSGKKVRVKSIGKNDLYHKYNLEGTEGTLFIGGNMGLWFKCSTSLEVHGIKAFIRDLYLIDAEFEMVN